MKKFLPLILLGVGILVVVGSFIFVRNSSKKDEVEQPEEETVKELSFDMKPFVTLTPSEDGHWLTLKISHIVVEAATLDYELVYSLPDGRQQGVPGTIKLTGGDIERKLLLGSESSGKFRYDEGVKVGQISVKFRNDKGKLVGKVSGEFSLQSNTDILTSPDGKFSYKLAKSSKAYFVTMGTFGAPSEIANVVSGPYAVLSDSNKNTSGEVKMDGKIKVYKDSKWSDLVDNASDMIGVFASVSE